MKKNLALAFILLMAVLFVYPAAAENALGPADLVDTLYSTDSERYMKSHYIIADTMHTLTDVQIASIIYEEIDGVKSAAADFWNIITFNKTEYLEMAVVELLLGEFTVSDGWQMVSDSKIKGLLDFMNVLDSTWAIDHSDADYKIVQDQIDKIIIALGRGQEVDEVQIDNLFKKIDKLDNAFFHRTKDIFTTANCISSVFTTVEIGSSSYTEMTNLFQAAAMLNTLNSEYKAIISKLKSNASSAGRDDLVKAINAVEKLALSDGKWSYAALKEYGSEIIQDTVQFFFKVLVDNLGAKWALKITGSVMAQKFFYNAAFVYKAGTFICDAVFDTSAIARVYAQLEALSKLEQSGANVLKDARDTLLSNPTYENAKLFHTAMRMQQQIEIDAVDLFIELCKIFNENGFKQMFGDVDYAEYIKEYQNIGASLVAKECCGYLEKRAEEKCKENLKYSISGGKVTITGCKNTDFTSLRIPDTIDGYPVTKIGRLAFGDHTKLTSIELPDIVSIGDYAFLNCTSLKNINLPSTLTSFDESAFFNTAITSVVIPRGITTIPAALFGRCTSLSNVTLHDDITFIGNNAFVGTAITSITLPAKITTISPALFADCTSLKSIDIPYGVKTIESSAFSRSGLTSVTIPESVTSIGTGAFNMCTNLKSINLPKNLRTIGEKAFSHCTSLQTVLTQSGSFSSESYGMTGIEQYAFEGCANLRKAVIPSGIKYISGYAFDKCNHLSEVIISDNVKEIRAYAFYNCSSLASISLPQTIEVIGEFAFSNCAFSHFVLPKGINVISTGVFKNCTSLLGIVIPGNVKEIGLEAFGNCSSLQNVEVSEGVTSIAHRAFQECSSLTSVTLPASLQTIGSAAFRWTGLTSIIIPDAVTEIDTYTFCNCTKLESIQLPKNLKSIGGNAFTDTGLKQVYIPDGCSSIDINAFMSNNELVSVHLPESLSAISSYAFANCTALKEINIPSSVKTIDSHAFFWCEGLDEIYLPDSVTTIGDEAFGGCTGAKSIRLPSTLKTIAPYAFNACHVLKNVDIPDTVEVIGDYAFAWCYELESVKFPAALKSIGEAAFFACYQLKDIDLPQGLTSISDWAFDSCMSLETVTLPDSLTSVPNKIFQNCTALKSAVLPASIASYGDRVFSIDANDSALTSIEYICTPKGSASAAYFEENYPSVYVIFPEEPALVLPASLKALGHEAMASTGVTTIALPQGMESIGPRAFADCAQLTQVTIPSSVTSIADDAFDGCTDRLVFFAGADSMAADYAEAHNIICIQQ